MVLFIVYVFIEYLLFFRLLQMLGIYQYREDVCFFEDYVLVVGKGKKDKKSDRKILSSRGGKWWNCVFSLGNEGAVFCCERNRVEGDGINLDEFLRSIQERR